LLRGVARNATASWSRAKLTGNAAASAIWETVTWPTRLRGRRASHSQGPRRPVRRDVQETPSTVVEVLATDESPSSEAPVDDPLMATLGLRLGCKPG
jgi:hypothetical protein